MEDVSYVVIWSKRTRPQTQTVSYGFAIKDDIDDEQSTYSAVDLTAEEVGQLLGGS